MQFITAKNVTSPIFAGTFHVNETQVICVESLEEHFVGFYGRYGSTFDSIGFNMIK